LALTSHFLSSFEQNQTTPQDGPSAIWLVAVIPMIALFNWYPASRDSMLLWYSARFACRSRFYFKNGSAPLLKNDKQMATDG